MDHTSEASANFCTTEAAGEKSHVDAVANGPMLSRGSEMPCGKKANREQGKALHRDNSSRLYDPVSNFPQEVFRGQHIERFCTLFFARSANCYIRC